MSTFWTELVGVFVEMLQAPGFLQLLGTSAAIFILIGALVAERGFNLPLFVLVLAAFIFAEEVLRATLLNYINQTVTMRPAALSLITASVLIACLVIGGLIDEHTRSKSRQRRRELRQIIRKVERGAITPDELKRMLDEINHG